MKAAAVVCTLAIASPAAAEIPVSPRARELAQQGRKLYDARDYHRAIAAFKEAYVLAPSPALLFDLAQSYRLAGDCNQAAWMYRRYLDSDPGGDGHAIAETQLQSLEHCAPRPEVVKDAPPPPTDDSPGHSRRLVGLGLATAGGVVLAGAAYFALDAHDAEEIVGATEKKGGHWADVAAANTRGERSAEVATALAIGGGFMLAAGAVCYGLGYRAEHARQIAVTPTTSGASVTVGWKW